MSSFCGNDKCSNNITPRGSLVSRPLILVKVIFIKFSEDARIEFTLLARPTFLELASLQIRFYL